MKEKLSVTIDEENARLLEKLLDESEFRNKSHIVEFAIVRLLEEIKKENKK